MMLALLQPTETVATADADVKAIAHQGSARCGVENVASYTRNCERTEFILQAGHPSEFAAAVCAPSVALTRFPTAQLVYFIPSRSIR
jgi:hypothetical protein